VTEQEEEGFCDRLAAAMLEKAMDSLIAERVPADDWDRMVCLSIARFASAGEVVTKRPWRKMILEALQ
jgi:hypothetical protein